MTDSTRNHDVRQVLPPDAIPSVDDPAFGPPSAYDGAETDDVVVVERRGEARAYPLRYLHYHEVVNDEFGDVPVAVTWCPLCGSAVVYDRRVSESLAVDGDGGDDTGGVSTGADDHVLELGVSGKLADDDLVMYDRETGSEWKQSSGVCLAGVHDGRRLAVRPAATTTVRAFVDDHPTGTILRPPGGESEAGSDSDDPVPVDYDAEPYESYFETPGYGLGAHRGTGGRDDWPTELADAGVDPKTVVVGLERGDDVLGVPLPVVESAGGLVRVAVGGADALVVAASDGLHAFEAPEFEVEAEPDDDGAFVGDGTVWTWSTGRSEDGRTLDRLPIRRLFAFAWRDDHGADAFYLD
ncbi:DUF3179 domain-containing protein [Halogeometricum limi]|uniref:DUF3179 domain-containing protein n=1 Tax=Halogeometricum limi TaxID=555875 RepID=A0A1I6GYR4_9EURY|nr:DUF3179 domain-containing protein [Halogeometricum limi]SFR47306.1 Protein of unknown function [Halogeometricum limi]